MITEAEAKAWCQTKSAKVVEHTVTDDSGEIHISVTVTLNDRFTAIGSTYADAVWAIGEQMWIDQQIRGEGERDGPKEC